MRHFSTMIQTHWSRKLWPLTSSALVTADVRGGMTICGGASCCLAASGLVDWLTVVGTLRDHACDATFCLPEQRWRLRGVVRVALGQHVCGDLASDGVEGEVQLPPPPSLKTTERIWPLPSMR
jgi:hypothetical protein